MKVEQLIWHNGEMVAWSDAKIHVLSHTLHYGGGALEGIRFYDTPKGPAIFRLKDHVDRLFYSADVLKMQLPYSKNEVIQAILKVIAQNGMSRGYVRPIAFYGYGKLSINPKDHPVELTIACLPCEFNFSNELVDVKVSRYLRTHPQSTVIDAKLCAHYLNGILATLELQGSDYHDVLYLDYKGHIAEGSGANFFLVKNQIIYTPKIGTILIGITRNTIMEVAHNLGFKLIETDLTVGEVYSADEAFFTGTAAEVTPIRSLNDNLIKDGKVGVITQTLKQAYQALVHGKDPAYLQYLTFVKEKISA